MRWLTPELYEAHQARMRGLTERVDREYPPAVCDDIRPAQLTMGAAGDGSVAISGEERRRSSPARAHQQQVYPVVLLCRAHRLPEPVPEFEFAAHVGRKFRADYCWPLHKLIVEQDGGIWSGGAHSRPQGILRDMERDNLAAVLGYRVLRYTPEQIERGEFIRDVRACL